jgi:hypothetical protein
MTGIGMGPIANRWQGKFQGELISPSQNGYDSSRRIWNGMIDRRPALIARCVSAGDVRSAVKMARAEKLQISVKAGGHGVAGTAVCDGGLMIDLTPMKELLVDPRAREIRAGPGVLWGEFDKSAEAHQLATTGGQVSHTGIAGLTLGGGLGYLMGKHGAACDNLLSLDVVTADGETLTASAEQNTELFWAMRGAGANFGIVTSLRYRLHPLATVLAGLLLHPRDRAAELMAFYREFLASTPDELDTTFGFLNSPDGLPLVGIIVVYAGEPEQGMRLLAPLRRFGPPVVDLIRPMAYTEAQRLVDDAVPIGHRYYWKSNFVPKLESAFGDVLRGGADAMPSPRSMILVFEIKGAIQRVSKHAMAFDHRDENFEMSIIAQWTESAHDTDNIRWARDVWTAAQPFVSTAVYANHLSADESRGRVQSAYGPEKFEKLAILKSKYDPTNFFCQNHNIAPRNT